MDTKIENKKKSLRWLGIALAAIVLVNVLSQVVFTRFDLTDDRHFSLTPFTRDYLSNLKGQVMVRVYLHGDELPVSFSRMKDEIRSKLDEFQVYAGRNVAYTFINPSESDNKDQRYGIYKQLFDLGLKPVEIDNHTTEQTTKTMIFPCAVVSYTLEGKTGPDNHDTTLFREIGINLLKADPQLEPGDEQNIFNSVAALEYEIINAIYRLSLIEKPRIAFIEGHGEAQEENLIDICTELSDYYDVRRGVLNGNVGVLDGFDAVVIAKPTKPFSEDDKFVLDQYIMQGGNVLWLIDATSASMDSLMSNQAAAALPMDLNIDDMLFTYGARVNANCIRDMQCAGIGLAVNGANGQTQIKMFPWDYYPVLVSHAKNPITKHLNYLWCRFAGSIDTVATNVPVQKTVLLQSGKYSRIVNAPFALNFDEVGMRQDANDYNKPFQTIGLLLEGNFESLYKDRRGRNVNGRYFETMQSQRASRQIIVSDGDVALNDISPKGEPYPLGFDRSSQNTFKGNKEFIVNSVNYLTGNADLLTIRLKEMKVRILDKQRAQQERSTWAFLNVALPLIIIAVFGVVLFVVRRRKYTVA